MVMNRQQRRFLSTPPSRVATGRITALTIAANGFYPRHPRGWRLVQSTKADLTIEFLSTPPSRVATAISQSCGTVMAVSIHATLAGGDLYWARPLQRLQSFYPRHPRGWRRQQLLSATQLRWFLSTPPSRVATFSASVSICACPKVSIHATLAGGDTVQPLHHVLCADVSIHATLAGGDRHIVCRTAHNSEFLSTPPSRVATAISILIRSRNGVSIHATLAGGDFIPSTTLFPTPLFLSTPPSRVATCRCFDFDNPINGFYPRHPRGWRLCFFAVPQRHNRVSIHATLAGGDRSISSPDLATTGFYPRHPRGWRRITLYYTYNSAASFYPRHPRGWRHFARCPSPASESFYPRHPRGWRRPQWQTMPRSITVSIHATLAGGDDRPQ